MVVGEAEVARATIAGGLPRRVVLLGASNLTLSFRTALEQARSVWGGPLEVLAALGHGRSYGWPSRVLGRVLPGILDCGLWRTLAERPPAPLAALVTDVGNDILYGADPATIVGWVEQCVGQLLAAGARVVLTRLPMASVARLTPWGFLLLRSCLFPTCRLSLAETLRRAELVDAGLEALAASRGVPTICPPRDWYGIDPIHLRHAARRGAWSAILAPWRDEVCRTAPPRGTWREALNLQHLLPERQRCFGIEWRRAQPCGRLRDGTTISLY